MSAPPTPHDTQGPLVSLEAPRSGGDPAGAAAVAASVLQQAVATDVAALLKGLHANRLEAARQARLAELEAALAEGEERGWSRGAGSDGSGGTFADRSALLLQHKQLRLLDLQRQLRTGVEVQQAEILGLPDRTYRKFLKEAHRFRLEAAALAARAVADRLEQQAAAIRAFKQYMQVGAG